MNIDRTMNTELSQLRDLADAQHKMIVTLVEDKTELLGALKSVVAIADRKTVEFDRARAAIARAEGRAS